HHQRRPLDLLDHLGDHHRLAGAGHAEQDLVFLALFDPLRELLDGLRLAACRRKASRKREPGHASIVCSRRRRLSKRATPKLWPSQGVDPPAWDAGFGSLRWPPWPYQPSSWLAGSSIAGARSAPGTRRPSRLGSPTATGRTYPGSTSAAR